jgi:hypothetical protein
MLAQAKPTLKRDSLQAVICGRTGIRNFRLSMQTTSLERNGLTTILQVVYARYHDYENFIAHYCNRICRRLYCTSSVADSGRITCSITNCKASHTQKSSNNGFTQRGRRAFNGRFTCGFAQSDARSEESRGCGSCESGRITVAPIQTWRPVQTQKLCRSESRSHVCTCPRCDRRGCG